MDVFEDSAASRDEERMEGEGPDLQDPEIAEAQRLRRIEALLFASPEPVSETVIADRVPGGRVRPLLEELQEHYRGRGINLRQVAGRWQFVTAEDCAEVLVTTQETTRKLSRPALETLAIIAYHQPCSRADIEEVRGVSVSKGSLDQLLSLGWIKMKGRRDAPGRPLLYGTTPAFLEHFDLDSVGDLPGLQDLKAQGLLEGHLPPGFDVPKPAALDGEDDDDDGEEFRDQDSPDA